MLAQSGIGHFCYQNKNTHGVGYAPPQYKSHLHVTNESSKLIMSAWRPRLVPWNQMGIRPESHSSLHVQKIPELSGQGTVTCMFVLK